MILFRLPVVMLDVRKINVMIDSVKRGIFLLYFKNTECDSTVNPKGHAEFIDGLNVVADNHGIYFRSPEGRCSEYHHVLRL